MTLALIIVLFVLIAIFIILRRKNRKFRIVFKYPSARGGGSDDANQSYVPPNLPVK